EAGADRRGRFTGQRPSREFTRAPIRAPMLPLRRRELWPPPGTWTMTDAPISRRALVAGAAGAVAAHALRQAGLAQAPAPVAPPDPTKVPGQPTSALGQRSTFERPRRIPSGSGQGVSFSPLQDFCGIVTPADLHFERHHAGVPTIHP